eukprot:TRINITY_DN2694_c0_g2_i1.p1 TRINITY_DN2694_c0_g2~~TRINITY_DN2694_c0_g2_i1.p1  ORF type:complete len:353 (-),score=41.60 TRINITY_DN2694_c0_g2_i1:9-1067(-)
MAITCQTFAIILVALLAIFQFPYHVGNAGMSLVLNGISLGYTCFSEETPESPQYRAFRLFMYLTREEPQGAMQQIIATRRSQMDLGMRLFSPLDPKIAVIEHTATAPGSPDVPVLWLNTSRRASAPVILHFHGGGYVFGSASAFAGATAEFGIRSSAHIASVEYRLAPENRISAAIEDAVTSYRWLLGHRPPNQIVVMGESAGGGLTLHLLKRIKELGLTQPAGAVLASPYVDITNETTTPTNAGGDPLFTESSLDFFMKVHKDEARKYSPVFHPVDAFKGFPPIYSVSGANEMLLPGIEQMCAKLREAGVNATCLTVPHMPHAFTIMHHWFPEADAAVKDAVKFIRWATSR